MNRALKLSFTSPVLRGFIASHGIKTLSRSPFCLPLASQVRCMGGDHHVPAHFKPLKEVMMETKSHMDFMPIPKGNWQEDYQKTQRSYNILLISSALAFGFTFLFKEANRNYLGPLRYQYCSDYPQEDMIKELYKTGMFFLHDFVDYRDYHPKHKVGLTEKPTEV